MSMTALLLLPALLLQPEPEAPPPKDPPAITLTLLRNRLNNIAHRHRHYSTDTERKVQHAAMIDAIGEEAGRLHVRSFSRVKDVAWKDGFATITGQSGRPIVPQGRQAVTLQWHAPLRLQMSHEEALAIRPNSRINIEAHINFHRGLHLPSPIKSEHGFGIYRISYRGSTLGTYFTKRYKITVGTKTFHDSMSEVE